MRCCSLEVHWLCVSLGPTVVPPSSAGNSWNSFFLDTKPASSCLPAHELLPCPSLPCPAPPCSYDTSRGISETLPDAAAAARLRSPAPACLYFIDHTYRVIYARITKTAGSAVVRSFGHIKHAPLCR